MSSIFDKVLGKQQTGTETLITKLQQTINTRGNPFAGLSKEIFSMESYSPETEHEVETSVNNLNTVLQDVLKDDRVRETVGEVTDEQLQAAQAGALAHANPEHILRVTNEDPIARNGETVVPVGALDSGEIDRGRVQEALEAFDESANANTMMISFAYNLKAARQDEFGEAFFPTVVVAPDMVGVTITVDLLNVMDEQKRKIDGSYEHQFGRKSLVNAYVYPTILNNDTTRIYPVYRQGNAAVTANFVDTSDIAARDIVLENGETVKTAPLAVGKKLDLLGLSQVDYLVGQNTLDHTDQIDPSVRLSVIYMKLADGAIIKFDNLEVMPEANFIAAPTGNNRNMLLTFNSRFMRISNKTTKADGSPLNIPAVTNNYTTHLHVRLHGNINLDTGETDTSGGEVTVEAIYDNDKAKLDLTKGAGQTAAQSFAGAKIIGYELEARRINVNRREIGQLLDINKERMIYTLPVLAPISINRPASEAETGDNARLDKLVQTTYVRCSNAAVRTLISAAEYLSAAGEDMEPELLYSNTTLGAARFFVKKFYEHVDLDVKKELNTLRSADRIIDVQAVLTNTIRELVFRAYVESNYRAATSVMEGETDKKPVVVIGTDPYIAAYLMVHGDLRTLGEQFDVKIVSTPNVDVKGKVFIAFGKKGGSSDVSNPLHFGNMFWRPEMATVLQVTRNGRVARELTVQPSFRHVVHCPIMATINVKNLKEAVTEMAPVMIKNAP